MSQPSFPTKILVITDGSEPARRAIEVAGELAAATKSELHLANITIVSRYMYPDLLGEAQVNRIKQEAKDRLDGDLAYAKQRKIELTESYTRFGQTDDVSLELADKLEAGLIVIANRAGNAFQRILLGNDVESVVRHAHCPVLVVRDMWEPDSSS